jgi:arginine/ornithine transport system substrate-binding protein
MKSAMLTLLTTALTALTALALFATSTDSLAQTAQSAKLRVGVEGAYPPFSELDPSGKLKGFDIDMLQALCARMKRDCEMVQIAFDGMIPALNTRKIDAIFASMSITEERKKAVAFSDKYYKTPARFVIKTGAKFEISPEGLKGKRIGVQRATVFDRFLTDTFKGVTVVRYTKQDEVYLDLAAGRIDAALQDVVAAQEGFLKTPQGKAFGFIGPFYDEPKYFGDGAGVAVRKSDDALREAFNAAIRAVRADGAYKKIQDKYFDFDVYGAGTPTPAAPANAPAKKK